MAYDSNLKSSRFLQGRRYTHNNLSDSQESFTSVLDLNSNEIYVDQGLIPSNNLPFNSSEDNLKTYVDLTSYLGLSGEEASKLYRTSQLNGTEFENITKDVAVQTGLYNVRKQAFKRKY